MSSDTDCGYAVADPEGVVDSYARLQHARRAPPLTDALHGDQLVVTLIRIPTHSDVEQQGTGYHTRRSRRSTSSAAGH